MNYTLRQDVNSRRQIETCEHLSAEPDEWIFSNTHAASCATCPNGGYRVPLAVLLPKFYIDVFQRVGAVDL